MSGFWFCCFMATIIYVMVLRSKVSANVDALGKSEKINNDARQLSEEAEKKMTLAVGIRKEGQRLKNEALAMIKKVTEENEVLLEAVQTVTNEWINDTFKAISDKLSSDNYEVQKSRLAKAFEICRGSGVEFVSVEEAAFFRRLELDWKKECVKQKARDEQARIRDIMREEQKAEKERASEIKRIEKEEREIALKQRELEERLKVLRELEMLKRLTAEQKEELTAVTAQNADLAVALVNAERAKSQAQSTKAGHVYVISNIGSFGENLFKVGMTRRLVPMERVKELGDASVPFEFDVHIMVATEDAPALESKLHEALWDNRVNLVNNRKEFFRVQLDVIKKFIDKYGGEIEYEFIPNPAASQWRESEIRRKVGNMSSYDPSIDADTSEEDVA